MGFNVLDAEEFEEEQEVMTLDDLLGSEDEEDSTSGVIKLRHPIKIEDEDVTEIPYDFSDVKPIQYINMIKRLSKKNPITVPELDARVQVGLFALASGVSVTDLNRLEDLRDYNAILSASRGFLL